MRILLIEGLIRRTSNIHSVGALKRTHRAADPDACRITSRPRLKGRDFDSIPTEFEVEHIFHGTQDFHVPVSDEQFAAVGIERHVTTTEKGWYGANHRELIVRCNADRSERSRAV